MQERSATDVVADPRVRLGVSAAALLVTAMAVRRDRVDPWEATAFRAVNGLPDSLHVPAWVVMQLGTLGAVPAAAGAAWLAGDGELAGRLLLSGTCTWALAKLVKRMVRRPRPATLLAGTRGRGRAHALFRNRARRQILQLAPVSGGEQDAAVECRSSGCLPCLDSSVRRLYDGPQGAQVRGPRAGRQARRYHGGGV
jgi:hypothetical protein